MNDTPTTSHTDPPTQTPATPAAAPASASAPAPPAGPRTLKQRGLDAWRGWIRPFLVIVVIVSTFRSAIHDWYDVPTGSMLPNILEGDRIVVNKLAFDLRVPFTRYRLASWGTPQRGDILTFWSPEDGTRLVKRCVAVGGDTVEFRNGHLVVNGTAALYDQVQQVNAGQLHARERLLGETRTIQMTDARPAARNFGPLTLKADEVFMMGDNRDNSRDARFFGPVNLSLVTGRAYMVAFSLGDYYMPRMARTFSDLPD